MDTSGISVVNETVYPSVCLSVVIAAQRCVKTPFYKNQHLNN
jgi:hypothetical protein